MKKILFIILISISVSTTFAQVTIIRPDVIDNTSIKAVNGKIMYYHEGPLQWAYELYATDGTDTGTYLVKDINPNYVDDLFCWATATGGGGMKYENYVYKNNLYFYADDGIHGMELWKSDATNAGTNMFYEFNPGLLGWDFTNYKVPNFCEASGTLFMNACTPGAGNELWISDGTTAGTSQVIDLYPGAASSNPSFLTEYNGKIFFTATDNIHGWELFCSDGTAGGTQLVKDILPGMAGAFNDGTGFRSMDPHFTLSGGLLYFQADDLGGIGTSVKHWWRTDGTDAGTFKIETTLFPWDHADCAVDMNGMFYFASYPGGFGAELWKSDGSVAGTTLVTLNNNLLVRPSMMSLGNYVYFNGADDDSVGIAVTDGSTIGSSMVNAMGDLGPFNIDYPAIYNSNMFFSIGRYDDNLMGVRNRMVQTNGTRSGTIIYPLAQPRSKVIPLGNDFIFYGSDTIEIYHTPFTTYLYKLTPAALPGGVGVGLNTIENDKTISCYPNPASDRVMIKSNGFDLRGSIVSLIDISGKCIYSNKVGVNNLAPTEIEIPATIADGFYLVQIQNSKTCVSNRLVIHRN